MDSKGSKKYLEIPIIAHESEKPSITFEEISSGKIYSSNNAFLSGNKENTNKDKTPITTHESNKPSFVFEEINSVVVPNFEE